MRTVPGYIPLASWVLYDLANQFFVLNIVSLYFPRWLTLDKGTPEIFYSLAFGVSMMLVAVCAPLLGTFSDLRQKRRLFLVVFTLISIVFTAALGFSESVAAALLFFAIANLGCQVAIIFYNSLLINVAPPDKVGLISGIGRMFGYSGAIAALYFTKPVVAEAGYRPAFIVTSLLFLLFSLPCMLLVRESGRSEGKKPFEVRRALHIIVSGMRKVYAITGMKNFLSAAFFLLSAVSAMMLFMGVYADKAFGLNGEQVADLIVFATLFAILGSIVSGYVSDLIGHGRTLIGVFILWGVSIAGAAVVTSYFYYWLVGAFIGLSLGGTWVVLRAIVVKLVSKENIGEAFALFNLTVYLGGVVGPLFWGILLIYCRKLGAFGYRIALSSMLVFVLAGIYFLLKMRKEVRFIP